MKELHNQVDIEPTSILHKHKDSVNKVSIKTLRGVACELLTSIGVDTRHSHFHNDPLKHPRSRRYKLDTTVLSIRDKETARRHDRTTKEKRRREEDEDMVKVAISKKK